MKGPRCALLIIDLQRYYLDPRSPFQAWSRSQRPDSLDYIGQRVARTVLPALRSLIPFFRQRDWPVCYAKLAGIERDRGDLHRFFRRANQEALESGYPDVYPLRDDPMSELIDGIGPEPGDVVCHKTSFSAFASGDMERQLRARGVGILAMAGLATSQCVETTARDGSERGFSVIHVEDAQADYSQARHDASLYSSSMVCGGWIISSQDFLSYGGELIESVVQNEFIST
jgi:ureidoacrylate peracid hydrolase